MTINNDTDYARLNDGTFTEKTYGAPEVGLAFPELPAYDPTFFYDRIGVASELSAAETEDLSPTHQALVRNATQAVNDAWVLDNGLRQTNVNGDWVDTKVYRDGEFIVADVQHKNQDEAPFGSLLVFDDAGRIVGQFDNHSDDFGPRWQPIAGLRAQLFADLNESSADGSLGDHL
ncbi:hypothetical protein F1C58_16560 (plasmid) [Glaciihabitans sp. INWT7]|uniref:hypothetical protein n=1 Tax=Glaciihabitans sp. INWT7 TaxID=2596912 RepID=UPI00162905FB|nr:hypothetical protein [Glaciihabitans sp. INWT7]QNE48669.1 hypothetical protein F1C58_16560 [Glaciihabitans sp. INWT7]